MRSGNNGGRNSGYYSNDDFDKDFYGDDYYGYKDRAEALGIYDDYEGLSSGRSRSKKNSKNSTKTTKDKRAKSSDKADKKVKKTKKRGSSNGGKKDNKNNFNLSPEKDKKRKKKKIIIIIACCLVFILAGVAIAYGFVQSKFNEVNRVTVSDEDWDIDPQVAKDLKNYKNILLLGIDAREGEDPEHTRSDGIIILSINKKTKEIKLTSVMRDSFLDVEYNDKHIIDKVTHAHAYGGPVNTVRAINRNLDLNIDDFVRVDWETVADVTNALGGIPVTIEKHEIDEINSAIQGTNSNFAQKKRNYTEINHLGNQTLNGVQIVCYCRIRMTDGDEQRADRMREVIVAAFEKAKTLKLSKLNNVADVAMSEVTTSMSSSTMMDLILDMTKYKIGESASWPYDYQGIQLDGVCYDAPATLKSNVIELHKRMFNQKDYKPTERCLEINEKIMDKSTIRSKNDSFYN